MVKPFFEAFPLLKLEKSTKEIMEKTTIERISSTKDRRILRIYLKANDIVAKKHIRTAEAEIQKQIFHTTKTTVYIYEHFVLGEEVTIRQFMDQYRGSILEELKAYSHIEYVAFLSGQIEYEEEGNVKLTIDDTLPNREKSNDLSRILEKILTQRCHFSASVRILYRSVPEKNEDDYVDVLEERIPEPPRLPSGSDPKEPVVATKSFAYMKKSKNAGSSGVVRPLKRGDHPDLLYGKDFDGNAIPIQDITDEIGQVIVRGQIRKVERRNIKNEKSIVTFDLFDFTDTIRVKVFVPTPQVEELENALKLGSYIKLKGTSVLDNFDHDIGIASVSGIKTILDFSIKRKDQAPKKRVELHCHTKMSDMDGVSEAKDLVKCAYEWGHCAIAITDHGVVQAFTEANHVWHDLWKKKKDQFPDRQSFFKIIYGMEAYLVDDLNTDSNDTESLKKLPSYHAILLAKNDLGRIHLYRLISLSHLHTFYKRPRILKSDFIKYREGLILGSACEAGELYRALLAQKPDEDIHKIVSFYDYLEIQPVGNNQFLIASEKFPDITSTDDIRALNKRVVELGESYHKPVVATCDVHFLNPEDEIYRRIIMKGKGFTDADLQPPLYLHTTEEMLEEFSYLGSQKAQEVVIDNTNLIADQVESIDPVRPDRCPPDITDSDQILTQICYQKAHEIYGEKLPDIVEKRLEKELHSIITHGFAVMYIIAQRLVWKSVEDGYLVGSRGSVGSSFVATMAGITEVNPLSPHYVCPHCYYSDFESEAVKAYSGRAGIDMPDRECPLCKTKLSKDGFDIPFETFLGFKGDKEPDIDLNFSGEYQSAAHKYTEVLFGTGQTFRAGTIATLADKTAYGYVKKYFEEKEIPKRGCEIDRIVAGCTGVRRSTGQHPGGIVVLPVGEDINSFTPVQHPANDMTTDIVTTHFDYHSIDHNLLKLDILGHDDPTMIRMLQDLTGVKPEEIPLDDPLVMSLFRNTKALGIEPDQIGGCKLGALGVPEFGTEFVIQMLLDTKPTSFSDLVRISGLSHGTDVWIGNAQKLIADGNATISTAICTRDDIMLYLIQMGVESSLSFTIMESVRKGKGLKDEWISAMKEKNVPDWYIWSCKKIQYMFPKAHAAAYVMMAWRIAYCKVYHPLAYYAAYFSIRAKAFSYELMCQGQAYLEKVMADYKRRYDDLSNKEKDSYSDMKIVQEMYARGFVFLPLDIYRAKVRHFQIIDGKIMPSLNSIDGLGEKAAESIVEAVLNGPFLSKDDIRQRTKLSKTLVDLMDELKLLGDLPESNQISLFEWIPE
ncbi:MAG: PolC-type DNA polymerase III [Lachnospiraceae bacterium]|jgi:DNA polymerase III alpha chain|nr:PolC-type DNA polymerase III [Lachnospiraceae bacterium]